LVTATKDQRNWIIFGNNKLFGVICRIKNLAHGDVPRWPSESQAFGLYGAQEDAPLDEFVDEFFQFR
jgi:hypothetical protein